MNEPDNEQLSQLQAEVQKLRAELQSLTKSMQLRDADTAAVTIMMQAIAGMTMLAPQISEPFVLMLREMYKMHRDKPKVTALYREHFDNAFRSLLPDHLKQRVLAD